MTAAYSGMRFIIIVRGILRRFIILGIRVDVVIRKKNL